MTDKRIVITGVGAVTSLGHTVAETWAKLKAGESGIDCITRCDTSDLESKMAGEIRDFDPVARFGHREARRMDRFAQIGLAAALEAWEQSGLTVTPNNEFDLGVMMSAGFGGIETIIENFHLLLEQG